MRKEVVMRYTSYEVLTAFVGSGVLSRSIGFSDVGSLLIAVAFLIYFAIQKRG